MKCVYGDEILFFDVVNSIDSLEEFMERIYFLNADTILNRNDKFNNNFQMKNLQINNSKFDEFPNVPSSKNNLQSWNRTNLSCERIHTFDMISVLCVLLCNVKFSQDVHILIIFIFHKLIIIKIY